MPIRDVSSRFRPLLDQVYAAAKGGAVVLDGQNVLVYHMVSQGVAEVEFGVGVRAPDVCWEVYGHWEDDPAKRRTDVYHLLR